MQASDYSAALQALGPAAYWSLDETTTPPALTAPNLGAVGAAGTGFAIMDTSSGHPGAVGTAFRIVNTGNVVGYAGSKVDVPFLPELNPTGSFTVEFWVKPVALTTDLFCPLSSLNGDQGARQGWLFYQTANNQWLFRIGGGAGYAQLAQGGAAAANVWQQVVGIYDHASQSVSLYVNGVRAAGPVASSLPYVPNTRRPFRMGGTGLVGSLGDQAGNRALDCYIDEVAVYAGVLSDARIASHYNTATTNPAGYQADVLADNPLGYWPLDTAAYTPPDPATLPTAVNSGSLGALADGKYWPGAVAGAEGPTFSGMGASNKGMWMNGIIGNVTVPNADGLNNVTDLTLVAWVKPEAKDNLRNIIAHGFLNNGEVFLRINEGKYEAGYWDGTALPIASAPMVEGDVGNWVFLAATYDSATGVWKLFRYNQAIATSDFSLTPAPFEALWGIGSRGDAQTESPANGRFFAGMIDEAAIFTKKLSDAQVQSLFAAARPTPILRQVPTAPAGTFFVGDSHTLQVVADGLGPFTYQWSKDGSPLAGQTGSSLALNNAQTSQTGTYSVAVSNANGSTTASVDITVVGAAPSISKQPVSVTRYVGTGTTLSVEAEGSAPLTYQWYKGATAIGGANSSSYTIGTIAAGDAATYTVKITNAFGELTSEAAVLTVLSVPPGYPNVILTTRPMGFWRLGEASGTAALDHWGGIDGIYNGTVALGQPGYSINDADTSVAFGSAGTFVGGISGTAVNFTGASAAFTVEAWVNGPAEQIAGAGIVAKGPGPDGGSGDEQFALDVNNGKFRFFVRQAGDRVATEVNADVGPNGSWQHVVGVYDGGKGAMSIYVNGVASLDSKATPGAGPFVSTHPVSIGARRGGVDPAYNLYFSGRIDEVAIYNKALTAEEVYAHFDAVYGANVAPQIVVPPAAYTTYESLPVTLSVSAIGSQPLSYQWNKNGSPLPGETNPSLIIDPADASHNGNYTVTVANGAGTVTSAAAAVSVLPAPTAAVAVPGLVAHYPFDGNVQDTSGRGNHGTTRSVGGLNVSFVNDAQVGSGGLKYQTDASDTANVKSAYVDLGVRPDLAFGLGDFSVAFWIRLPENDVPRDLPILCNAINSANNPGYTFAPAFDIAGSWGWSLYGTGANDDINVYGPAGALIDKGYKWYHVVHSFNRAGSGNTYIDGRLVDSRVVTIIGNLDTGNKTSIGQDPTGTYPESGTADLDDMGIFKRALTQLEAQSIYMAGLNRHSFVNLSVPATIGISRVGGALTITYTGTLQSSDTVNGTYTDVTGASSPYAVPTTAPAKFYRASGF